MVTLLIFGVLPLFILRCLRYLFEGLIWLVITPSCWLWHRRLPKWRPMWEYHENDSFDDGFLE